MKQATIVTRTAPNENGTKLIDPYKDGDKVWTPDEDAAILREFVKGNGLAYTAAATYQDQIQVAIRLTRLLLDPPLDIKNEESATQNRRRYRAGEKDEIVAEYQSGDTVTEIAETHNRTILAVAWQLLDHPSRPLADAARR